MKITSKKKKKDNERGKKKKKKKRGKKKKKKRGGKTGTMIQQHSFYRREGEEGGIKTAIKSPLKTQYAFHKFRGIASTDISAPCNPNTGSTRYL